MSKILYLGNAIKKITSGADAVNKRNLDLLNSIFDGNLIISELEVNNKLDKLRGYFGGLKPSTIKKTYKLIEEHDINTVFVSHSALGRICKSIKKKYPKIRIITFYHNIEKQYAEKYLKSTGLKGLPLYFLSIYNEGLASKYSDENIVLNNRDQELFLSYYGKYPSLTLPVSYEDIFCIDKIKVINEYSKFNILFVGVAFFANTEGISWFINNVLPIIDANLTIIGKGMDAFFKNLQNDKVCVHGFVEDISSFYYDSNLVLAPIFTGGGMKTKIAEAMMYGKTILGTKEAFEGYDLVNNVHFQFSSKEECLFQFENIKNLEIDNSKYNEASRNEYLAKYSNNIILQKLKTMFEQ